jgi:hypothetical protein
VAEVSVWKKTPYGGGLHGGLPFFASMEQEIRVDVQYVWGFDC